MTAPTHPVERLLAELDRRGITIEAHGERLRYSPRSAVTPDLAGRMKAHKAALLAILAGEPLEARGDDAGPIDARQHDDRPPHDPSEPTCGRCGRQEFTDVPIHDGQSIRRDCARCNRTWGFPAWRGVARAKA